MLDELLPDERSDAERDLAPAVDVPAESDADPRLQRRFWLLVVVFNVALMAVSVGAMLAVFRGQWDFGTSLVSAGLILAGYGLYKYRAYAGASGDAADSAPTERREPDVPDDSGDGSTEEASPEAVADLDAHGDGQ